MHWHLCCLKNTELSYPRHEILCKSYLSSIIIMADIYEIFTMYIKLFDLQNHLIQQIRKLRCGDINNFLNVLKIVRVNARVWVKEGITYNVEKSCHILLIFSTEFIKVTNVTVKRNLPSISIANVFNGFLLF